MTNFRDLELRIRAQLQGGKDLEAVAKSIEKIGVAIDEQTKAAKRGDNSIDELKASLEALAITQRELQGQSSAIKYFQRLTEQLQKSEERVRTAAQRYTEYEQKLKGVAEVTEKQQATLIRYSASLDRANKAIENQRQAIATYQAEFAKAGIAVADLGAVQRRNEQLQGELALVYNRGRDSIKSYAIEVRNARNAQAELDRQQAESQRNAELFERAQRKAAEAAAARARAAQEVDAARSSRNAEVAAARRLDQEQEQAAKRAAELAALQKDIVARSAQAELNKQADAAQRNAREFTTLARAADNLQPKVGSLRDTVRDIINPTEAARRSLGNLEKEVEDLAAGIGKINGPISDYKQRVDQLNAAQRALQQQSGLVDAFSKQLAALRQARDEFVRARTEVNQYAAKVREGGAESAQFAAKLAQAEASLKRAAQAYAQQAAATRQSREALREAGVQTNNLAAAQQRLTTVARTTVSSVTALDAAVQKYGQTTERARAGGGFFRDEGRTTLSYLQRIRGEVLSLVAAYGGLFTVIRTAQGAIEASQNREGVRNQLAISVGNDRAAIDAEYEYVKAQADRIGIEFERAIKSYTKFSAAATLAGRGRQEIREIFETFAEVGRVANLSADELDGVFKALEQITSKGKIQAEELRGQLGDRLFGAFQVAAKALKDQFPDLDKALENGLVSSEQLVLVAREYRNVVANQLPAATKGLAAEQARLTNAVTDFKLAVADSGFVTSYSEALQALTEFLRSDDGQAFADSVGKGFKALADLFVLVLRNIDEIVLALKLFFTLFAYTRFASGIKALGDIRDLFTTLTTAAGDFGKSMSLLQKAFAVLFAFIAGFQIGTYLRNEFQIVRDAGTYLVTSLIKAWVVIKASYQAAIEALPVFTQEVFEKIVSVIKSAAKGLVGIFAGIAEAVGLDGLANSLRNVEKSINTAFSGFGKSQGIIKGFRENLKRELAEIDRIREEMLTDSGGIPARQNPAATPTQGSGGGGKGKTGPSEADINKRQREIENITRALEALEAKVDRRETETLARQIEAIDTQYAALARRIEKLGGEAGKAFMMRLTAATDELRTQTIKKFNQDLLKEQQALLTRVENAEEQAGKRAKLSLEARLSAIVTDYEQAYRELAELRAKFVANDRDTGELEALRQRLDSAKAVRLEQETTKFNTEELDRREKQLNDTIAARDKLLAAVNTQKEIGAITDVQAAEQLNAIQAQYVPKIEAAAAATREWAIANAAIFNTPEQQQVFLATLDAIAAKATSVAQEFSLIDQQIIQAGVSAVNNGLNLIADGLQGIATGQLTIKEGFQGLIAGFAQFAASFLRDIALMIIKLQIFTALQAQGGILGRIGGLGLKSIGVLHSGGVVGSVGNRSRTVSPAWFANAPRYHSGGLPGLAASEYPAILEKGEEVLSKDSPRNVLNGGMSPAGGAPGNFRVVLVDDRQKVPEAMNSPEGETVMMQFIRRNAPTIKQALT